MGNGKLTESEMQNAVFDILSKYGVKDIYSATTEILVIAPIAAALDMLAALEAIQAYENKAYEYPVSSADELQRLNAQKLQAYSMAANAISKAKGE